ncbi:hypothetical protein Anas_02143 [Armadillidium nasatum]|uniref:Distal membrane-arm assembly complex protein 1-like domain-containing protein n=1 Tax=Armadillidium nasatum TaxID=96803 RepID=A0A5N5T2Q5_9CRUS|nr:hypothetical protein Anas_02143 [Armadillidium nasatum]
MLKPLIKIVVIQPMEDNNNNNNASKGGGCTSCRVIGGLGLSGAGGYVVYYGSKSPHQVARIISYSFAGVLFGLGIGRVFNVTPFSFKDPTTEPN